jgi:hypothetical protein
MTADSTEQCRLRFFIIHYFYKQKDIFYGYATACILISEKIRHTLDLITI